MRTQRPLCMWSRARIALGGLIAALSLLAFPTASMATATPCPRVLSQVFDVGTSTTINEHTFSGWATTGPGGCAYTSLRLIAQARDTYPVSANVISTIQFGTGGGAVDTGNDYDSVGWVVFGTGGSTVSFETASPWTSMYAAEYPASGFPAVYAGSLEILFPNAFSSDFDGLIVAHSSTMFAGDLQLFASRWSASGPLTSFRIFSSTWPFKFEEHSIFYLYEN